MDRELRNINRRLNDPRITENWDEFISLIRRRRILVDRKNRARGVLKPTDKQEYKIERNPA